MAKQVDNKKLTSMSAFITRDTRIEFKAVCKAQRLLPSYELGRLIEDYVELNKVKKG